MTTAGRVDPEPFDESSHGAAARTDLHPLPDGDDGRDHLVESAEPSVVFSSLAAQCVPELCDSCTIDITDGPHARYRIVYPPTVATVGGLLRLANRADEAAEQRVRMPFDHAESTKAQPGEHDDRAGLGGFHGVATFVWHRRTPTQGDRTMAAVLVDNAVQTVVSQRRARAVDAAAAKVANLEIALQASRNIGAAIGILMSQHKITEKAAFDLLSQASQSRNRKLRDLAVEVIDTGWLDDAASAIHPGRAAQ